MIVVAVDNKEIKKKIDEVYNEKEVYSHDISYMEGVIEYLGKETSRNTNIILITKDSLKGDLTKEMYLKQIKLANNNVKIILLVDVLNESYKKFLFANEIFNVIEGNKIDVVSIIESINSNDKIIYKNILNKKNFEIDEEFNENLESTIISKQFISIYGTSGSGKSYIASLLSKMIASKIKIKIGMLDMDFQNPAIDIYNNLNGYNNSLSQVISEIDKDRNINEIVDEYMYNDNNKKNLYYMSNNISIYECKNKLSVKYYRKIYYSNINKYDYVIVDLPSSPFIDVVRYSLNLSSTIFFVVNPNYISLRQAIKYLELITKLWEIPKSSIYIIVNKVQKNSLDISQITNYLKDYKVVSMVNFENNIEGYINGSICNINSKLDEDKIMKSLGVNYVDNNKNIKKKIISMFINKERNIINDSKSIQNS